MIAAVLLLAAMQPAQFEVPSTYWVPPDDLSFVHDSTDSSPFFARSVLGVQERVRVADRGCVIWGRTGDVAKRCRSFETSDQPGTATHPNDGVDNWHFFSDGGPAAEAWCWAWYPINLSDTCDIYFEQSALTWLAHSANIADDQCARTSPQTPCGGGETWSRAGARLGAANSLVYEVTARHEIGHTLGLFHTEEVGTSTDPCDETSYDCGVMAQFGERVSWWPNVDDISRLRQRWNAGIRRVQFTLLNPAASTGAMSQSAWTTISGLTSSLSPRLSCKPESGTGSSCVMTTVPITTTSGAIWGPPVFHVLNVVNNAVSVTDTITTSTLSETPVDVAFGNGGRFMGIGKRRANDSNASRVVLYKGDVGTGTVTSEVFSGLDCSGNGQAVDADDTNVGAFTHTEPRITYHETQNVFVSALVARDGFVRLTTFDIAGNCLDTGFLDQRTIVPAEVSCDSHLGGSDAFCRVYTQPHGTNGDMDQGEVMVTTIMIGAGGNLIEASLSSVRDGPLDIVTPVAQSRSAVEVPLIGDVATYGNGRDTATQFNGNAYFLSADRYRDVGGDPAQWRFSTDFSFSLPLLDSDHFSMVDGQTNVTSWDWNEGAQRVIGVRLSGRE